MRRFVLPAGALPEAGHALELPPDIARHVDVLRLERGAELRLTDGAGLEATARLELVKKKAAVARIIERRLVEPPPGPEIVLLQGVGKGEKLDAVARQIGELGAARLVPVASARAVARREGKVERLRVIADDALRVSGGAHRMRVDDPVTLEAALELDADVRLAFVVGAEASLREALAEAAGARRVALLVGPEGGFSETERAAIEAAGWRGVSLGPRVLRTETAGPAVVAMTRFALLR